MDGADPLLPEDTRVGEFRIRGFLGEGAMGQVYLAQDVTLGRRVALKLIKRSVMQHGGGERLRPAPSPPRRRTANRSP